MEFEEHSRYQDLVEEHCREFNLNSPCYPRLISFIGNTGAGKSAVIRLLLERPRSKNMEDKVNVHRTNISVPVVGRPQSTVPTSGDLHLYRDPAVTAEDICRPLFYADCEGFNGGSQKPEALVNNANNEAVILHSGKNSYLPKWAKTSYSYIKRQVSFISEREAAIQEMFPRLLYNFSDVVVHVMLSAAARQMEKDIIKLLEWAQASSAAATNRVMLPHLIILLNQSDDKSEWDSKTTTAEVFAEQNRLLEESAEVSKFKARFEGLGAPIKTLEDLLKKSYSSIQFIRVPRGSFCTRLSIQLRALDAMIREASLDAQCQKSKSRMLLSSDSTQKFFKLAFDHFSANLYEPFDFLEKLFSMNPLPNTISDNVLLLMRAAFYSLREANEEIASKFCQSIVPVVCSAVVLDVARTHKIIPMSFIDIFGGTTSNTIADAFKVRNNTYQSHMMKAFEEFIENTLDCEWKSSTGECCVNKCVSHDATKQHQNQDGAILGYGEFDSKLMCELSKGWENGINDGLKTMDKQIQDLEQSLTGRIWGIHQNNLKRLYRTIPKLEVFNLLTCFSCFCQPPIEQLPCGHGICANCLDDIGERDPNADSRTIYVRSCDLHHRPRSFSSSASFFRIPAHVGRRVLTLDGGGVRGMIGLKVLSAIEAKFDHKIPIQAHFDLIGGTGPGGLFAIGLGLEDWTVRDTIPKFTNLASHAFTRRKRGWFQLRLYGDDDSIYQGESFDKAIRNEFEEIGEKPLMGLKVCIHGLIYPLHRTDSSMMSYRLLILFSLL